MGAGAYITVPTRIIHRRLEHRPKVASTMTRQRPWIIYWTTCSCLYACALLSLAMGARGRAPDAERKILKKVEAQYPAILKRRGIGGTVRLKVSVKPDGTVKDVEVLGGNPALADAAEKAVRQWKFAPGNDSLVNIAVSFDPNS